MDVWKIEFMNDYRLWVVVYTEDYTKASSVSSVCSTQSLLKSSYPTEEDDDIEEGNRYPVDSLHAFFVAGAESLYIIRLPGGVGVNLEPPVIVVLIVNFYNFSGGTVRSGVCATDKRSGTYHCAFI